MKKYAAIILSVIITLMVGGVAFASDVSDADYYGTIRASNNSTSTSNVAVNVSISTPSLITCGFLNSSANNSVIRKATQDVAFMPGYDTNPWIVWYDSIGSYTSSDSILYTGNVTGGDIVYFPDTSGMTVSDNETLELGDNFTFTISDLWIDSNNGTNKNIIYKEDAFTTVVSPTESGNITASIWNYSSDYPTVESTNGGYTTGLSVHSCNLPASIAENDLILVVFAGGSTITSVSWQTGYIELYEKLNGVVRTAAAYKIASGGETTVNVTTSGACNSAYTSYRISGYSGVPECGTAAIGTDANPNPPAVTASWGSEPNLFIEVVGYQNGDQTVAAYSANYSSGRNDRFNLNGEPGVGSAQRELTSNTDNPGNMTISAIVNWSTNTIVIAPDIIPLCETTLLDIDSGEHDYQVTADGYFFGSGIDNSINTTFISNSNLVYNAPLYDYDLSENVFISKDENRHICTVTQASYTDSGRYFDGINDFITLDNDVQNRNSTNFTAIAWVKFETAVSGTIFGTTTGNPSWQFMIDGGTLNFYTRDAGGTTQKALNPHGLVIDTWYMLSAVRLNDAMYIYVNTTQNSVGSGTIRNVDNGDSLLIANGLNGFLEGYIGDTITYSEALSADEIENIHEATKWKYQTTVVEDFHYNYLDGASVLDNANDYQFFLNNSVLYTGPTTIDVGGTPVSAWEWEYGAIFHDSIGSNNAIPDLRTTSSDLNVSAELISFDPMSIAAVDDDTATSWPILLSDAPDLPDTMYTEEERPGIFFEPIIHALATATDIPDSLFWYNFAFIFIIGGGIFVYYIVSKNKAAGSNDMGRLFIKVVAQAGIMCFCAIPGLNIFGFFVPLYYLLFSGGVLVMAKDYGW